MTDARLAQQWVELVVHGELSDARLAQQWIEITVPKEACLVPPPLHIAHKQWLKDGNPLHFKMNWLAIERWIAGVRVVVLNSLIAPYHVPYASSTLQGHIRANYLSLERWADEVALIHCGITYTLHIPHKTPETWQDEHTNLTRIERWVDDWAER